MDTLRGHLFMLYFLLGRTEGGLRVIMIEMVIGFNNSRQVGWKIENSFQVRLVQ